MGRLLVRLCILGLLASPATMASSYVMVSDEALLERADAVVVATVLTRRSGFSQRGATEYSLGLERTIKGRLKGNRLTVLVPGGTTIDGRQLKIYGAPQLERGERGLFFLGRLPSGNFGFQDLMLGVFLEVGTQRRSLAVRNLSESRELGGEFATDFGNRSRDFALFADWLTSRVSGPARSPDYFVTPSPEELRIIQRFTLTKTQTGAFVRWFTFEQGAVEQWRFQAGGQPGLPGEGADPAGVRAFRAAIDAWNGDPTSDIAYELAGTTTANLGLTAFDDINAIIFGDPNQEIAGTFDCTAGGLVAIGGPWFGFNNIEFKGETFRPIVQADIIINDGVRCIFEGNPQAAADAEEIFGHELGHTLGIGHSCGDSQSPACNISRLDQALMRTFLHRDGRGSELNEDDRAALAFLYGTSPAGPGLETFIFALVGDGGMPIGSSLIQFKTELVFHNTGADTEAILEFFSTPNGDPMDLTLQGVGTDSAFQFPLSRGETVSIQTLGQGSLKVGYAQVRAGPGVGGTAIFTRTDNGTIVSQAGVPAAFGLRNFTLVVDAREARRSGLALVFPTAFAGVDTQLASANVTFTLYDSNFQVAARADLSLPPGSHRSRFADEIFSSFGLAGRLGSITVQSDQPIAAVTLREQDDNQLDFPFEVPILTAFPVLAGRADSLSVTAASFSRLGPRIVGVKVALDPGPRPLAAVFRLYDGDRLVGRFVREVPAQGPLQEALRPTQGFSWENLALSVQFLNLDGPAGEEIPIGEQ